MQAPPEALSADSAIPLMGKVECPLFRLYSWPSSRLNRSVKSAIHGEGKFNWRRRVDSIASNDRAAKMFEGDAAMRERIVRPIEAGAVTLIGAGVAYFVLPPSLGIRHVEGYVVDQLINMIWGAVFGAAGYFAVSFAARRWGMAMFRFSIREIILVTIIVAVICGWVIEHNERRERFWHLFNENIALQQKLDTVAPNWRQSQ